MVAQKTQLIQEFLAGHLHNLGYDVSFEMSKQYFDVVIVNTCGFIGDAKQESIDNILLQCALKQTQKSWKGCSYHWMFVRAL